jgi:hypothetical protein
MRKRNRAFGAAATLTVGLALGAPVVASAGAGSMVKVTSTVTISAYGYKGTVKASNPNCVEGRTVVLKQKGYGKLGSAKSETKGKWEVSPEKLHFKGPLPYELFAEVKPLTQATAGPIYKCGAATSKAIEIAGG